jgi:GTP-binding protein
MPYILKEIEFIKSSPDVKSCPDTHLPEYAFVGRSNVGKSSLINMITGKKKLAKISSLPGKTRLINHFLIDHLWYLVDLPGYGYAQVNKSDRGKFLKMIQQFLLKRLSLACLFVLVDCRHEPQEIDLIFLRWLGENSIPFAICFTKTDKISSQQLKKSFERYSKTLLHDWEELPPVFFTSTENAKGREEILQFIDQTNIIIAEQSNLFKTS